MDETSGKLKLGQSDQFFAVNELMLEAKESTNYFLMLVLSSIIIAAGVLLANSAILIGGMLITPLLTPVLLIGLGITTGNLGLVRKSLFQILKSVGIIFAVSFIAVLVFGIPTDKEFFSAALFTDTVKSAFLYFLVAFASGLAATFAWIRKKVDNMLPGVSIAVSLVPPISLVAIWLGSGNFELMRFFLAVFLFNLAGVIGGALILFSLFGFHKTGKAIDKHLEDLEIEKKESTARKEVERVEDAIKEVEEVEKAIEDVVILENNPNENITEE